MSVLGTVKLVGYNFVPRDYEACDGQLLAISSNPALFSILGVMYGGDGRTTFGLPNLQTRVPIHADGTHREGTAGGATAVTLNVGQMPEHTHAMMGTEDAAGASDPAGKVLASGARGANQYAPASAGTAINLEPETIAMAGGGGAHENMQPYLTLSYVVCTQGSYPSRDGALPDEGEDYLGDIKTFGFGFAPQGWAECNGQLLPIAQYQSLYALLGTTYGGDGKTTFALPDLRGRVAVGEGSHSGSTLGLGQKGGAEDVTLTTKEIPSHDHQGNLVGANASQSSPGGAMLASSPNVFTSGALDKTLDASALAPPAPNGQPHNNMMPFETVNFCICLNGLFPSRN